MMGLLEDCAEAISGEFNSQDIVTTQWAYATVGTRPGVGMMGLMERRAEATISVEFNSQNVAQTLWAFATMRRIPGGGIMELLEDRVEAISGQFSSQGIAQVLVWYFTDRPLPVWLQAPGKRKR